MEPWSVVADEGNMPAALHPAGLQRACQRGDFVGKLAPRRGPPDAAALDPKRRLIAAPLSVV
jgi:hypothetical protein